MMVSHTSFGSRVMEVDCGLTMACKLELVKTIYRDKGLGGVINVVWCGRFALVG